MLNGRQPQAIMQAETAGAPASGAGSLRSTAWLVLGFGLLKFILATLGQIAMQHAGYGVFRDELYFVVCGRHLAWGYVDQPPIIPLVARISALLFGLQSLALFRTFTSLAGAAEVALTGLLAWRLGAGARYDRDRARANGHGDRCHAFDQHL